MDPLRVQFIWFDFNPIAFDSSLFHSVRFNPIASDSIRSNCIQFESIPFGSIRSNCIRFKPILIRLHIHTHTYTHMIFLREFASPFWKLPLLCLLHAASILCMNGWMEDRIHGDLQKHSEPTSAIEPTDGQREKQSEKKERKKERYRQHSYQGKGSGLV